MKLEDLFKQPQALPAIPKIVHELIDSFNNESIVIEEITDKLSKDPVLSARLLRLANSAYYHVSRTVGTVDDAVMMLGFVTVRTLVISSGLTRSFKAMPGIHLPDFWRYSTHTAATARWLAKQTQQNTDQAFTLGLMHAIGQLVMHAGMPEAMFQVDKEADPMDVRRFTLEKNTFGFHFGHVGGELARQWKFPAGFDAALDQFDDPCAHTPPSTMALILNLAAWRARAEYHGMSAEDMQGTLPVNACEALGLKPADFLANMPPMAELCEGLEALVEQ